MAERKGLKITEKTYKFGKHFIVGFDSFVLTTELEDKLIKLNPCGVIFYDCNIQSKQQVKRLITDLKSLLGDDLLVSVDQEGGKVQRLRKICTNLPSYKTLAIASKINPEYLAVHSETLASELIELGFNLVFAPCADLNTNPLNPIIGTRSLGDDYKHVSQCLIAIHNSYKKYGLISCAKHYPGHGDAGTDSHFDLPLVLRNKDEHELHMKPFQSMIDNDIEMIMLAHLVINHGLPVSIDPKAVEFLRNSLGYKGLIVSDEITMKALSRFGDYNQVSRLLLEAGNDLIIWNTNLDDALSAARYLDENFHADLAMRALPKVAKLLKLPLNQVSAMDSRSIDLKLLEIAKFGIQIKNKNSLPKISTNTKIIINKAPKLEKELIENVFNLNCIEWSQDESLLKPNLSNEKVLLIEFQISDLELQAIKSRYPDLIHVSTDICHQDADIWLNGASEVHYKALKELFSR